MSSGIHIRSRTANSTRYERPYPASDDTFPFNITVGMPVYLAVIMSST